MRVHLCGPMDAQPIRRGTARAGHIGSTWMSSLKCTMPDAFHDEVDAYPAITVIRRQDQGLAVIASAGPEAENVRSGTLLQHFRRRRRVKLQNCLKVFARRAWNLVQRRGPMAMSFAGATDSSFAAWKCFPALESNAKVGIGVATGNDSLSSRRTRNLVEPSRLLKLALAKDLLRRHDEMVGALSGGPVERDGLVAWTIPSHCAPILRSMPSL